MISDPASDVFKPRDYFLGSEFPIAVLEITLHHRLDSAAYLRVTGREALVEDLQVQSHVLELGRDSGEAEVDQTQAPRAVDEDVVRGHVTM